MGLALGGTGQIREGESMSDENKPTTEATTTPPVIDATKDFPVLPLRQLVVYPHQVLPLTIGRDGSLKALEAAMEGPKTLFLLTQRESKNDDPQPTELYEYGTLADILKVMRMPDGSQTAIVQGRLRCKVERFTQTKPHLRVVVKEIPEEKSEDSEKIEALVQSVRATYQKAVELAPYLSGEHLVMAHNVDDPGRLADVVASSMQIETSVKQSLLETLSAEGRLTEVHKILNRELRVLELSTKIQNDAQGEITKSQREYFLRQQLKAIRRELGEDDESEADIDTIREKIAEAKLPEDAAKAAEEELRRLQRTNPSSPEHSVIRTYLDWLLSVPWSKTTEDRIDLAEAKKILERDHYDLEKVKKRIVEFLAVRKLKPDSRGPILCFVGPPGVGKTSLGRSIAEALGRKFVRVSLGGMRDEAEIRGHRRTYVGALPGRIIQGLKKAGTMNPVFMLDEIDKLGSDFRGDPSSALLEALDPEQNHAFSDHYLEVSTDLSKVMFVATANWADPIPPALRDRLEMIEIPGYTNIDKALIAKKHLLPKEIKEHGLKTGQAVISKAIIDEIIGSYTREAGVRNLGRTLASVVRGVAAEIAEGTIEKKTVTKDDLVKYLGPPKFFAETAERTKSAGVATGLAWTPVGGEILFIEATKMAGKGAITLTGSLGDVMKESAQAALSYIRTEADHLGIDPAFLEKTDIHVHVPSGAVPKDGPSAGITMVTALVSLLTQRRVKDGIAMTGETTLRGHVLPVGGIKEKVLAAHRAGIRTIILPEKNRHDIPEIPEEVRKELTFIPVKSLSEVLENALVPPPTPKSKKKKGPAEDDKPPATKPEPAAKTPAPPAAARGPAIRPKPSRRPSAPPL
jgi:ATP-dependent Lon protease